MEKRKSTSLEKAWILYDVGNSAFILMVSTLFPIYFNSLAEQSGISNTDYLVYWGYAVSVATLVVAVLGPILGTIADTKNYKKPLFVVTLVLGAGSCMTLGLYGSWLLFLTVFVIGKIGYSASLILYDSMINDITESERLDTVSSMGYAWGYIGSCVPFILCLVLVLKPDLFQITTQTAMLLSFLLIGIWWVVTSLPLISKYKQINYVERTSHPIKGSFQTLFDTFKEMRNQKSIFLFLLSFFFYIDGVYTVISMATAYGTTLGLDSTSLLLALLVTQFVAFPSALIIGALSKKIETAKLIGVCILAYTGIAVFAVFMTSQVHFWILAICVGMFQGGIQALSRSHFAKLIPENKSGEYFGILDICGKGASFIGTFLVGLVTQLTGRANLGIGFLSVIFLIGFVLFQCSVKSEQQEREHMAIKA